MKKILCALLALGMTFAAVACGDKGSSENGSVSVPEISQSMESESVSDDSESVLEESESSEDESSEGESSSEEEDYFIPDYTGREELTLHFENKVGTVTYNTGKNLTIDSVMSDSPIYLGAYSERNVFTVDGGEGYGRLLTVVGQGGGVVQANGGQLIFRNLTIRNNTHGFDINYYRPYYAEFGGKVRFENCVIDCSIQLRSDAEAEFINCEIISGETEMYGIWVADGSARFEGCTFTGYRALKVHEIGGMDVENVTVENCTFDGIEEKPAIAIDFEEPIGSATITFTGCAINNCGEYKRVPEVKNGEDGFYESKTDVSTFTFTATDCTLDEEPFEFANGEITFPEWY